MPWHTQGLLPRGTGHLCCSSWGQCRVAAPQAAFQVEFPLSSWDNPAAPQHPWVPRAALLGQGLAAECCTNTGVLHKHGGAAASGEAPLAPKAAELPSPVTAGANTPCDLPGQSQQLCRHTVPWRSLIPAAGG